jgi:hypothetical protein
MKLINKIAVASVVTLCLSYANPLASMAGTWSAGCYKMPNGKFASRTVTLEANGSVVGDMTIFKDSNCTKEVKKVHKEYTMKLGKKSVGDDGKEAYEVDKVGKKGWKVYSMIRIVSPTVIIPADRTKDRNGSTPELRANHFSPKSVQCVKK